MWQYAALHNHFDPSGGNPKRILSNIFNLTIIFNECAAVHARNTGKSQLPIVSFFPEANFPVSSKHVSSQPSRQDARSRPNDHLELDQRLSATK